MASVHNDTGRAGACTCPKHWVGNHHWSCQRRRLTVAISQMPAETKRRQAATTAEPDPVTPVVQKDGG